MDQKTLEEPVSERLHKKLDEIVRSGDEDCIEASEIALRAIFRMVKPVSDDSRVKDQPIKAAAS